MDFTMVLKKLRDGADLDDEEASQSFLEVMDGRASSQQAAAYLALLGAKGETVAEIAAFAKAMRKGLQKAEFNTPNLVDTAGTGGDGKGTFNISTCAAIIAAGAGSKVAKHGNRSATGRCGSADVMEELGVTMAADMGAAEAQLNKAGLTFLFAPYFHKSMRNVSGIRKELGFKTVFNILGPLTNPMHARRQVIGSYDKAVAGKLAGACGILGAEKALVVSSDIDEISVSGETQVYEVDNGRIKSYTLNPEDFGFSRCDVAGILAEGRAGSADTIIKVLSGREGPARSVALLNAGAAVYASGEAGSIAHGVTMAERSVDSGMALEKLRLLRDFNGHS